MWRDDAHLLDVLIAARKVLRYTDGMTGEAFREDGHTQDVW